MPRPNPKMVQVASARSTVTAVRRACCDAPGAELLAAAAAGDRQLLPCEVTAPLPPTLRHAHSVLHQANGVGFCFVMWTNRTVWALTLSCGRIGSTLALAREYQHVAVTKQPVCQQLCVVGLWLHGAALEFTPGAATAAGSAARRPAAGPCPPASLGMWWCCRHRRQQTAPPAQQRSQLITGHSSVYTHSSPVHRSQQVKERCSALCSMHRARAQACFGCRRPAVPFHLLDFTFLKIPILQVCPPVGRHRR